MSSVRRLSLFHAFPRGSSNGRLLLVVTSLMLVFGTIAVASASEGQASASGGTVFSIMVHDVAYLCLGLMTFYLAARIRIETVVRRAPTFIFGGLALLAAVMLVGVSANGGKRWLNLRVIYLQPSEIFKLCTVLYIAWLVERHHNELGHWRQLAIWTLPVSMGAGLVVLEPDIGTSSVIALIAVAMLAVAGLPRWLLTRIVMLGGLAVFGYIFLKPYSARRFFAFLHPNHNVLGANYQLLQSKIGLGAGGVTGLGLGHSREKWGLLPNPHTDFIFTIIGEELGLVGTLSVIALFVLFLFSATNIARQSRHGVMRLMAVGISSWIALEALINIASVVGWWAVTGIPLPFFSYGGTALISELAAVGLLYNIANDTRSSPELIIRDRRVTEFRRMMDRGGHQVAERHNGRRVGPRY